MHQSELVNQQVSIERFEAVARRSVNMRVLGVTMLGYAVCAPFWGNGMMPFWWSVLIGSGIGGLLYIVGTDYVDDQVAIWVDKMMLIHSKSKQDQLVSESSPIEESEVIDVAVFWQGTDQGWTVRVTPSQIGQLVEANMKDRSLKRKHLTADVWPQLSRKWAEGDIQKVARILGFIDFQNRFNNGWGGAIQSDQPEVGPPSDSPNGVGGYPDV